MLGLEGGVLLVLVLSLVAGVFTYRNTEDSVRVFMSTLCTLSAWVLIVGLGFLVGKLNVETTEGKDYVSATYTLKSVAYKSEVESSTEGQTTFFLGIGRGSTSSTEKANNYYYVVVDYPEKGSKVEKFPVSGTYINEVEGLDQPYMEVINKSYTLSYPKNIIAGGLFKPLKPEAFDFVSYYVLYVPVGTLQVQWEVDLSD